MKLEIGINIPVTAGIMPLLSKQIEHCLTLSKATLAPPKFTRVLEKYGDQPTILPEIGIIYAVDQIIDLLAWGGVDGIHLYSMNRPEIVLRIVKEIAHLFNQF